MNLPEFASLLDLTHGASPIALVGAFFPFLKKEKEEPAFSKGRLLAINKAVYGFLEVRGVTNFKVYTIAYDNHPVVLIQAEPQKKLRFSNIIEIQVKKFIRETLSIEVPAVFWRFKTDYSDEPGPEQADYEFDEQPSYPQEGGRSAQHELSSLAENEKNAGQPMEQDTVLYLPPHLSINDMQVEEIDITMGEFDAFLKGAASKEKKDEQS